MRLSDLLNGSDAGQIADLWDVFMGKCQEVIQCWEFLEAIELTHDVPNELEIVDLPSLTNYIMQLREFDLAYKDYERQCKDANIRLDNARANAQKSALVFDCWVKVGDYGIMFHKALFNNNTVKAPTIDTWENVLVGMRGDE